MGVNLRLAIRTKVDQNPHPRIPEGGKSGQIAHARVKGDSVRILTAALMAAAAMLALACTDNSEEIDELSG